MYLINSKSGIAGGYFCREAFEKPKAIFFCSLESSWAWGLSGQGKESWLETKINREEEIAIALDIGEYAVS